MAISEGPCHRRLVLCAQATYLGELYERLEELEASTAEQSLRARRMLRELRFTREMIDAPVSTLSGGWRTRLSLARCLFAAPDVLLLDEPTNHIDLRGALWLQHQLLSEEWARLITVCVSHDRAFLDAICTDVIVFADKRLTYHHCSYGGYLDGESQAASRNASHAAAVGKQVDKQKAFIAKQKAAGSSTKKAADDNKLRQAKEREKKLERLSYTRESGGRFKTHSLAKVGVHALPDKVGSAQRRQPVLRFSLPQPTGYRGPDGIPALTFDHVSFTYSAATPSCPAPAGSSDGLDPVIASSAPAGIPAVAGTGRPVLSAVTLQLGLGSRVAIVGQNGAGKTTLVELIAGNLTASAGEVRRHHSLRIATVSQHQTERLRHHLDKTAVDFVMDELRENVGGGGGGGGEGAGGWEGMRVKPQDMLNYLGGFGLSGDLATIPIGMLSGGQKARLTLARTMWDHPHLLILDEPTNHLDSDALEALQLALGGFQGGIVAVSHSADFLASFSKELWIVDRARVSIHHTENEADFDAAYSQYCDTILAEFSLG